ncbi:hypothetical protein DL96DRAFT_520185 [Flagelloscypha sp. PMI_526]|nr:hypothetical protein DL96DRAFT_520185 [Flagelloscypha sp. PMI_526]
MASLSSVPVPSLQPDACQLLHLPEELFFRVLQVCTVLSVLTIRQCCKLSCQYTKDRSVWIHQLSSFLAEMKIEPCGVVPDIDRLSPLDLELLVTRHLRTRCRAWRYRSRSLPYASWRASGSEGIQSVLMVRGGRFLLGCSGDTLFFWDIGFQVGRPAERETLVCSTPIDLPAGCTSNSTYIWKFHDIGPLLYVSIWTAGNWGLRPYFYVYKMDLSARRKGFHLVSHFLIPKASTQVVLIMRSSQFFEVRHQPWEFIILAPQSQ